MQFWLSEREQSIGDPQFFFTTIDSTEPIENVALFKYPVVAQIICRIFVFPLVILWRLVHFLLWKVFRFQSFCCFLEMFFKLLFFVLVLIACCTPRTINITVNHYSTTYEENNGMLSGMNFFSNILCFQ